jgi:hypothetical protein
MTLIVVARREARRPQHAMGSQKLKNAASSPWRAAEPTASKRYGLSGGRQRAFPLRWRAVTPIRAAQHLTETRICNG